MNAGSKGFTLLEAIVALTVVSLALIPMVSFVSQAGLFDITGTMWQWGTDGHPTDPRPSIFGGRWFSGDNAGSRYADLGIWAGDSNGDISARGRSDHLTT